MASSFKIELIEKTKTDARVKKGNVVEVSFEKEKDEKSTYRAGKNFGKNGEYLFETIVSEGKKVVRVYNANNSLSNFIDGKNVVQDGNYIVFEAAEIKVLPNSQFLISTKSTEGKISTVEIRAGELVVNRGKESITTLDSKEPINLELSENFFQDIISNEIKCGALPAQAFSAAEGLKGIKAKTFNVNGEQIQLLTVNGEPNRLFMSSGTELREVANVIDGSNENIGKGVAPHDLGFQFRGGDFAQGKVGAVASILENVSSEKTKEIIDYIKNENTRTSVESVSSETYRTRIKNVSKLSVKKKHQETKEFDSKNFEPVVLEKENEENSSTNSSRETEIKEVQSSEDVDSNLKASEENSNSEESNEESKEEVKEEALDGVVVQSNEVPVQQSTDNSADDGEDSEAEEVSEIVAEEKNNSANNKQESQGNQEASNSTEEEKKNSQNPNPVKVTVPLKPLKVLKHCLLGGVLVGLIALTVIAAIGGLIFPAFMGLSLAVGMSTIVSSEVVADIRDRSERKQKAMKDKKKSLEKEIKKEKEKQANLEKQENKDKQDENQKDKQDEKSKEQEDEESLEPSDDKKKKKKKDSKLQVVKFFKTKQASNKEKIDEAKVKVAVETGGTKGKEKAEATVEKKAEKAEEKTSKKKTSRELKQEAELNAIRERIVKAKSDLAKTEATNPEINASKSDNRDMGM